MKYLRPLSFILVVVLSFTLFGLNVSAAGEEFDSDLTNWVVSNPDHVVVSKRSDSSATVYDACFKPIPADTGFHTGFFYDATSLTAGNSYTLKFKLYSVAQLKSISGVYNSLTDAAYYLPFTTYNGSLIIGLGSLDSSGNFVFSTADNTGIVINKDNYSSYFGNTISITFTMPNAVNSAIGIYYIDSANTGNNCHFYMGDFSLTTNTVDVESIIQDSIHAIDSLKVELSGSVDEGFGDLTDYLGDAFSNLGDSISDGFDSLLDGFEDTLTRFGNLFLYLTWDETPPENPFEKVDGPYDSVEIFFEDLFNSLMDIKANLISVLDSISSGIYIFDIFTERFMWIRFLCGASLAWMVYSRIIGL